MQNMKNKRIYLIRIVRRAVNKLELSWIGKYDEENHIKPEPRILIENPEYSYTAEPKGQITIDFTSGQLDPKSDNMLIHGDNLLALKSLEQQYAGQVKCIYIDPPYNTGSAFEHYDDNLEHSIWLSLMKPRLELLRNLLADNGSIWISIDDYECHYLKVLCDEVFGRKNFVASIIWRKNYAPKSSARHFSVDQDYILIYAKCADLWIPNLMPRGEKQNSVYKNPDNDPRGRWRPNNLAARNFYSKGTYSIKCPGGRIIDGPPSGSYWRVSEEKFWELDKEGRIYWGKDGNNVPAPKIYLSEVKQGVVPQTFWPFEEVGHTQEAKKEIIALFQDNVFATPKPERLIERVLTLATNPGDLVLDSFLGSGTTAAVAHKMGRRWIGIELGDHAYTHCYPRMKAVCDGEQGGISKAVKWQGGGGFKFYELAPSILEKDKYGNYVISKEYNAEMLAAAMARHEGYTYAPDADVFWKQGYSGDKNYIFTTTAVVTPEYLDYISSELGADEYLLIMAKSYDKACEKRHQNITVHPIPKVLLGRCEYGRDHYDLNVILQDSNEWEDEEDV